MGSSTKIIFVDDRLYAYALGTPQAVGGAERQQWLLARLLAATGWSVTVGVRESLPVGERCVLDGVKFTGIGRNQILLAWYQFFASERPHWWYWRSANHLWGPAVTIAQYVGVQTIFAVAFDSDVRPRHALSLRQGWWPLYAWGLSQTDRIFVQHRRQLAEIASRWRSKVYLVPSIADRVAVAKPHSERGKYVAWVGMLRQPKRPDLLIEIARKTPAIRFVVCGAPTPHRSPPGYGEWIVRQLHTLPNVEYLGQVVPERAQQVIANAAMLLSTSDMEGFPNTFLQAWSSGTPVVSLQIDPDCIIKRMGLGIISGSVEDAAADITTLMNSPQRRDKIAAHAQQYVEEAHSETAVITAFESAVSSAHS
jgi:glycosyltransferase involved in cell wall biosynthesis